MKARLPHIVILAGSLTFLASLYLTWVAATLPLGNGTGVGGLLNLLSSGYSLDGWGTFGQAAALAAIALIGLVLIAFSRPELAGALPFGGCAIALATLALVNAAALRTSGIVRFGYGHASAHLSVGAYVGGAAAVVALLGAAAASRNELAGLSNVTVAPATLLTAGLVAAYILPTLNVRTQSSAAASGFEFIYIASSGTAIMLLIASFGLTFWFGAGSLLRRLSAAAVVLVLTIGGFSVYGTRLHWPYEAWLAIGCAVGLLVLAVATSGRLHVAWPKWQDALALAGVTLLFVSLFFRWDLFSGVNGWIGGLVGGLAAIFVVLRLGFGRRSPELVIAIALSVLGSGLSITTHWSLGYGAYIGFAGAALLSLSVAPQLLKLPPSSFRIIPLAASAAFIAVPVLDSTGRIPQLSFSTPWELGLFEAAAIVAGLRLCGRWWTGSAGENELLLLPFVLLALLGLNLASLENVSRLNWQGLLSVSLCVFLLVCAWVERKGGIPEEIWRVDRISTAED